MKRRCFLILFLFCTISANAQDTLRVRILIPELSGLAFNTYDNYIVHNDTMYYEKTDPNYGDSTHARVEKFLEKFKIDEGFIKQLNDAVNNLDYDTCSVKIEDDCDGITMGWPRFFVLAKNKHTCINCLVANVYRKKYYDIVDIFNSIWAKRHNGDIIIDYDKDDLLKREKRCKGKR